MSLLKEPDFGTPAKGGPATVSLEVDGLQRLRSRGHVGHAGGRHRRHRHPQAVRHRQARRVRLLPAVPGRDRRPPRDPGLVHHPGGRRHGRPDPDAQGRQAPRERHGAVHLRPPAGLPHLFGQRRLRTAGHGRRGRPASGPVRLRGRKPPRRSQRPEQPVLRLRPVQVHRLLPLRARLRRDPGHVRADHRGPRASRPRCRRVRASPSWTPSACPAAPACRRARRPRCRNVQ